MCESLMVADEQVGPCEVVTSTTDQRFCEWANIDNGQAD